MDFKNHKLHKAFSVCAFQVRVVEINKLARSDVIVYLMHL
jgi:hypothetical protein